MNKTVSLVNEWGAFEAKYPDGTIEDFCRYYLVRKNQQRKKGVLVGGVVPHVVDGLLLKIIGRIAKLNMLYAKKALIGTGLNQIEEFGMLLTIRQEKNPQKTAVIYASLFELSSGTEMLNRLKKRGLIKEYADTEDRRSKRLSLTAKGEKAINRCSEKILKNANMLMHDLSDDDKKLCIRLLQDIEIKYSAYWQKDKKQSFEEIYNRIMSER